MRRASKALEYEPELTAIGKDEKAIVWTNYVENITIRKNILKEYKPLVIQGDVPVKDRADAVKAFQDSEKNRVMIANP